ncbi:hypothetical protein ABZW44_09640 [Streptomyces mirabilis]|uniref:hypothetical protein n=1 Tax=Streptomyces mirabilis TaxID=68239 RepID=UPI00331EDD53
MELASFIVAMVAALLSVVSTIAAWRAVRPRPMLTGRIVGAWHGSGNDGKFTLVGLHVVLTNRSSHPVYPIGATLRVKIADNWFSAGRIARYQVNELSEIEVSDGNSGDWAFQVTPRHVMSLLESKVEHGTPLTGLLIFYLDNQDVRHLGTINGMPINEYKLTIIDIFEKKHSFKASRYETESFQVGHPSLVEVLHEMGVPARHVR